MIESLRTALTASLPAVLGVITMAGVAGITSGCAGTQSRRAALDADLSLRLNDLEHRTHDLDAVLARGETVALVFWQPSCHACAREAPELNRAVAEHGKAIHFLGVVPGVESLSDRDLLDAAARFGYRFPQTRDSDESLCRAFGVTATPTLIVIGAGREVRYRGHSLPASWGVLTASVTPTTGPGLPGRREIR